MRKKEAVDVITIGDAEFTPLYPDLIPSISEEGYQRLKEDIDRNGVLVPPVLDEKKGVIDGVARLRAASELGMKKVLFQVKPGLSDFEKKELAITLNAMRRQWDKTERLELAIKLRKEGHSLRRIGEILNISHQTVKRHVDKASKKTEFPAEVLGKDGKKRAAKAKTCILAKTVSEVKEVCKKYTSTDGLELPQTTIDVRQLRGRVRLQGADNRRKEDYSDLRTGNAKMLLGDFRIKGDEVDSNSVDLIFTDPPYLKENLGLWEDLSKFAARVLKHGGILLSYSGAMYLPEVMQSLGSHLEYWWTCAVRHAGGHPFVAQANVFQCWKPILGYYKPPFKKNWSAFPDMASGGESKDNHVWEQPVSEAAYYIKALCPKGGIVCDPMMGSGTSLVAAKSLGFDCIGIEIDKAAFGTAIQRVEGCKELESSNVA